LGEQLIEIILYSLKGLSELVVEIRGMMHGDYLNKAKVTIVKFQNIMGLPFGRPIISLYLRILFALR